MRRSESGSQTLILLRFALNIVSTQVDGSEFRFRNANIDFSRLDPVRPLPQTV